MTAISSEAITSTIRTGICRPPCPPTNELTDTPTLLGVVVGELLPELRRSPRLQHRLQKRRVYRLGLGEVAEHRVHRGQDLLHRTGLRIRASRPPQPIGPLKERLQNRLGQQLITGTEVVVDRREVGTGGRDQIADARARVPSLTDQLLRGLDQRRLIRIASTGQPIAPPPATVRVRDPGTGTSAQSSPMFMALQTSKL